MGPFESEIQELIYGILTGDTALVAHLGGEVADKRIYVSLNDTETQKMSETKPAYVVIETMPAPAPIRLGSGIDDWAERYCLHVFGRPENRDLRAAIEGRFRELLHRRHFITEHFMVYEVFEDGREGALTESGLYDYRYTVALQFLPKR
jgi:hypothetical protein